MIMNKLNNYDNIISLVNSKLPGRGALNTFINKGITPVLYQYKNNLIITNKL